MGMNPFEGTPADYIIGKGPGSLKRQRLYRTVNDIDFIEEAPEVENARSDHRHGEGWGIRPLTKTPPRRLGWLSASLAAVGVAIVVAMWWVAK